MNTLILYGSAMLATLILDGLWLGVIMAQTYQRDLGQFLRFKPEGGMDPIIWAAAMVYVLIPAGVTLFVLPKVSPDAWMTDSLLWGFIFGFILYGVYEFTNYSLLKDWPLNILIVDLIWGGVLGALTSLAAAWVQHLRS